MIPEAKHKLIITGTGRSGTTFLVQLLTELGLDTGYTPQTWRRHYNEHCAAGLEHDLDDPRSPYIVKDPALCRTLPALLARRRVIIDCALIPIRRLDEAASSRIRVGGSGDVPGGLTGTGNPREQKAVLADGFHQLMETLAAHDIPHVLLHFPRFARDPAYTYNKLRPLLGGLDRARFDDCFRRVARPDLIHSFAANELADDAGRPAKIFLQRNARRRLWRHGLRLAGACALLLLGWVANDWADDDPPPPAPPARSANPIPIPSAFVATVPAAPSACATPVASHGIVKANSHGSFAETSQDNRASSAALDYCFMR